MRTSSSSDPLGLVLMAATAGGAGLLGYLLGILSEIDRRNP